MRRLTNLHERAAEVEYPDELRRLGRMAADAADAAWNTLGEVEGEVLDLSRGDLPRGAEGDLKQLWAILKQTLDGLDSVRSLAAKIREG